MKAVVASSVFVAAAAAKAPLTNLALTWKDCGGIASIDNVEPSSVPLGTKTTISGSGSSPVKVTGGKFAATVKAGWIPLASCSGPLGPAKTCSLPLGAGSLTLNPIPLPIGPGPATLSLSVELSASLPAQLASTTTHATAVNEGNQKIVCLDVYLKNGMGDEIVAVSNSTGSPFADIMKVVCKVMKSGIAEGGAAMLICSHMPMPIFTVGICKKLVKWDWDQFTKLAKCTPDGHSPVPTDHSNSVKILDEILKLVCRLMKNGYVEAEAAHLICSHLNNDLEIEGCKVVVNLAWNGFENKECPAETNSLSVQV